MFNCCFTGKDIEAKRELPADEVTFSTRPFEAKPGRVLPGFTPESKPKPRLKKIKMYWKCPILSPSSTLSPMRPDAPGSPRLRAGARIRWLAFWSEPLNFYDQNDHFTSPFRKHCANSIHEMDNTCNVWQGGICFGSTLVWEIIIQPL